MRTITCLHATHRQTTSDGVYGTLIALPYTNNSRFRGHFLTCELLRKFPALSVLYLKYFQFAL